MNASPERTAPAAAPARRAPHMGKVTYGIVTLLLSAIVVQSVYALIIRPRGDVIMAQASAYSQDKTKRTATLRSIYIIVKDYEQETAIILTVWAMCLIGYFAADVNRNRKLLANRFIDVSQQFVILPEDVRTYTRQVQGIAGPDNVERLLPRTLCIALARFGVTRSVHEAASAAREECETEAASLDSDLSMLRFVVWAIPAVGFVGTVRGIGNALQEAQRALGGDISGVTLGLGITFNSTLTALTLCIVVMFCLHQLQQAQDRLVLDTKLYIDRRLIAQLRVN